MKPRSAKNKGKRLQNEIRDLILENFPELEPDDCKSTTMGEAGVDLHISPAARKIFPFSVEMKNQEKISIWSAIEQCEKNTKSETTPLLIFRRNRSKTYAVLEVNELFKLLKQIQNKI